MQAFQTKKGGNRDEPRQILSPEHSIIFSGVHMRPCKSEEPFHCCSLCEADQRLLVVSFPVPDYLWKGSRMPWGLNYVLRYQQIGTKASHCVHGPECFCHFLAEPKKFGTLPITSHRMDWATQRSIHQPPKKNKPPPPGGGVGLNVQKISPPHKQNSTSTGPTLASGMCRAKRWYTFFFALKSG